MTANQPTTFRPLNNLGRYRFGDDGSIWTDRNTRGNPCDWRQLTGTVTAKGYVRVMLRGDDGTIVFRMVHNLILEAFRGPCPPGMECCHRDCDKRNNRLDNLRWDTPKANVADSMRLNRRASRAGSNNGRAKIDEAGARAIKDLIASGLGNAEIARRLGIRPTTVWKIRNGRAWTHVG